MSLYNDKEIPYDLDGKIRDSVESRLNNIYKHDSSPQLTYDMDWLIRRVKHLEEEIDLLYQEQAGASI